MRDVLTFSRIWSGRLDIYSPTEMCGRCQKGTLHNFSTVLLCFVKTHLFYRPYDHTIFLAINSRSTNKRTTTSSYLRDFKNYLTRLSHLKIIFLDTTTVSPTMVKSLIQYSKIIKKKFPKVTLLLHDTTKKKDEVFKQITHC